MTSENDFWCFCKQEVDSEEVKRFRLFSLKVIRCQSAK